jgi:transposase InsO family protein
MSEVRRVGVITSVQRRRRWSVAETLAFAHAIRLVPCFTPVRSPESNGIAEAFVKTFKRDYVRLNPGPDAAVVMAALDHRFEDLYEIAGVKLLRSFGSL